MRQARGFFPSDGGGEKQDWTIWGMDRWAWGGTSVHGDTLVFACFQQKNPNCIPSHNGTPNMARVVIIVRHSKYIAGPIFSP